jgi:hypothetical protein
MWVVSEVCGGLRVIDAHAWWKRAGVDRGLSGGVENCCEGRGGQQADRAAHLAPRVHYCGLDIGVPLRDVQEAASHADPRATMRYDRARVSLDRHATYIVSTYVAGAAR